MSDKLKRRNLIFFFIGYFFVGLSVILIAYFLPFYLKEQGLKILQIGALLTVGVALGMLIASFIFGKILKKIPLRKGLNSSGILAFFYSFLFYIFPNFAGVVLSEIFGRLEKVTHRITSDVTMQHNVQASNHRNVSSYSLIVDSLAVVFGLIISIFLIQLIGFRTSFLVFSLIGLLSLFFYSKVNDKERFKIPRRIKKIKLNKKVKLLAFAENSYWFALASSFVLVITFLVTDYFSNSIKWIALLFGILYLTITISTIITKRYLEKFDLLKTSIFGVFLQMLGAVVIIFSVNLYNLIGAMILEGIGAGIWVPSKTAYLWKQIPGNQREEASAYVNGWRNFASAAGPLFGGILVTYFGILSPFYFKAVVCLIPITIYIYLLKLKN